MSCNFHKFLLEYWSMFMIDYYDKSSNADILFWFDTGELW